MEAGSGAQNLPKQWPVPYVDYKYISLTPYDSTFFYAAHIIIFIVKAMIGKHVFLILYTCWLVNCDKCWQLSSTHVIIKFLKNW